MPTISNWLGGEGQPEAIADVIGYKSVSITAIRNGVSLGAQTVRLETLSGDRQMTGPSGRTYSINAMVLGYKGHPTIANTDLQAGDTFAVGGVSLEVIAIAPGMTDNLTAYLHVRS